jgi:hypothetical protein
MADDDFRQTAQERRLAELEFVEAAYPDAQMNYNSDRTDGSGFSIWVSVEYDAADKAQPGSCREGNAHNGVSTDFHIKHMVEEDIVKLTVFMPQLYPESSSPSVTLSEWRHLKVCQQEGTSARNSGNGLAKARVISAQERHTVQTRLDAEAVVAPGEERSLQVTSMC